MTWAYIEASNSSITEYDQLPKNWKNISNFFALEENSITLKALGWYVLFDKSTPITNDLLEYHGEPEYSIDHELGVVTKVTPVLIKDNPPTEAEIHAEYRQAFMENLRRQRNQLLKESDWTQMLDIQHNKPDTWITVWREYRQALRDLPQLYMQDYYINIIDTNQIRWPQMPTVN